MSNPLPLTGVCVFELGSNVSGPYGTWILAALGAEVIKVERPGTGDDARGWGPPFWREAATVFHV
ncbi:MAG: CoA transferase, partial [Alphaproteobacteria bacterium]